MGQIGNRLGVAKMITQCQGGGDKKAGLPPTATGQMLSQPFAWRAALGGLAAGNPGLRGGGAGGAGRANGGGKQKFYVSTVNQLGGIGRHRGMFRSNADGVSKTAIRLGVNNCAMTIGTPNPLHWQKVVIR